MTITLAQFHKNNPVVAEGVRKINEIQPRTEISYLTYRAWVMGYRKISPVYLAILRMKGIKV